MNTVCSVPIEFACFVVHMMLSHCEIKTTDSTGTMSQQGIMFEQFQFQFQYGVSD